MRALQVEVPPLPDDFPVHGVITKEPDAEMLGLRVAFNIRNNGLHYGVVIDGRGRVLWVRKAPEGMRILRIREGRDKQSLFYATEQTGPAMGGDIVRFDLVTQEEVYTAAEQHHHDFVELPDGDLAWLAHDIFEESLQPPFTPPVLLSGDRILRAPVGAGPGEYDTAFALREDSGIAPWPVCSHMFDSVFLDEELDWTHSNSLGFDDEQNAFRMLIRWWDSIAQVGIDGEVDWFAGGMHSDFEVGEWFDHGHASELSGDRVWVFDNGNHGDTPRRSRLVRLQIDPSSGTAEVVQEVEDPYGRFHGYLGDVLELPGGNLLALWSGSGHLTELTADGEVVWEYAMEEQIIGRIQLVDAIPGPTVP